MPETRAAPGSWEAPGASALAAYDEVLAELARNEGWLIPSLPEIEVPAAPGKREPLFVHHLPRESGFVGRGRELELLREMYQSGRTGMIAIVGIGGAGKSVLLDRFLRTIDDADGLIVWSFYVDQGADQFLAHAYRYVTGQEPPLDVRGRGLGNALCEALKTAGRVVLVLDGLERAQRDDGRIATDAIRDVMERLALGWGSALALVTTRLSLVDLQHYHGDVYREVRLGELSGEDAAALLGRAGVRGTTPELVALAERFGGHALTVSLLGAALARFYDGDPARAGEIVGADGLDVLDETGKLGRVLAYYERQLAPLELAVLQWMAALPRGATVEFLERFMVQGEDAPPLDAPTGLHDLDHGVLRAAIARLLRLHLIQTDPKGGLTEYGVHAAIKAYFYERLLTTSGAQAHEAAYRALDPQRTLAERPVRTRPVEQDELDRVEDVLFHALRAGHARDACDLYRRLLGYEHLGAKLGAYALGERVVRGFFPEGDPARPVPGLDTPQRGFLITELGLFLRQLGEVRKAADCHALVASMAAPDGDMPTEALLHLAQARLLQGSYREVQWCAEQARRLAGENSEIERTARLYLVAAHTGLGELDKARFALEAARRSGRDDLLLVTVRVDLNLRVGKPQRADQVVRELQRRLVSYSFREDHVLCDLLLAECAFALGNLDEAIKLIAGADLFVERSSWRSALCRIHRLRAQVAQQRGDLRIATAELDRAQGIAEQFGFVSMLVDFMILRGELKLASDPASAIVTGKEAYRLATNHACRYRWGQADALELLGRALVGTGDRGYARVVLKQALGMRRDLGNTERTARVEEAIAEVERMSR